MKKILILFVVIICLVSIMATPANAAGSKQIISGKGQVAWSNGTGTFKINIDSSNLEYASACGTFILSYQTSGSQTRETLEFDITQAYTSTEGELLFCADTIVKLRITQGIGEETLIEVIDFVDIGEPMTVIRGKVHINESYDCPSPS